MGLCAEVPNAVWNASYWTCYVEYVASSINAFDEIIRKRLFCKVQGKFEIELRSSAPNLRDPPSPFNVSSPPSPAPSVAHSNPFPPCRLTNRPSTSFFYIFYPDHSCPPLQLLHLPRTHNPKHSPPPTVQHHPPNIAPMCPRNDGI